ncbi:biotin transporter BioY [Treponema pectinovorum]|uniref:biotin transporter BioY n=1 Tax=Treponema pectinovorum TaxID=164 RepID=UPI0011C86E3E|nr:biotin transporter BioY [Treponema pectinovorum]
MDKKIFRSAVVAFFAAIICATSFFRIPIPGLVSGIVIQNAVCIMTAVLLGGFLGAAPTTLFFVVGVLGLPIFSGGQGGFQVLMNINGGFRIGWVLGAFVASLIAGRPALSEKHLSVKKVIRLCVAVFAGMLLLYFPEIFYVVGFKSGELGVGGALKLFFTAFFAPFLFVDFLKAVFVILISLKIRPVVALYLYDEKKNDERS